MEGINTAQPNYLKLIEPEPVNRVTGIFKSLYQNVKSSFSNNIFAGTAMLDFQGLIDKQIYWQVQMQSYSAESNIEKSKHEIAMSPIRNIRVS